MQPVPQDLLQLLSLLTGALIKDAPELGAILDRARSGEISEVDAIKEMSVLVAKDPSLRKKIEARAMETFAPLRQGGGLPIPTGLPPVGGPTVPFQARPGGMPALNPLYAGALAERLQFDGDIPELRTGPLPAGAAPAVPVDTDARNPVALGMMLRQASEEVAAEIAAHDERRTQEIEAVAQGGGSDMALIKRHAELVAGSDPQTAKDIMMWGSQATDLPAYRRGSAPALRPTARPDGTALAAVSVEKAREMAWKFFSTAAGRTSAVNAVRMVASRKLGDAGVRTRLREPDGETETVATHVWKASIAGGAGSVQPGFAVVDVAGTAIAAGLLWDIGDRRDEFFLDVRTLDSVSDREVGWVGKLSVSKKKALADKTGG